jgi:arylsulfatase A-like enzyme
MHKLSRRDFLAGAAAMTVPFRAEARRPNILFLMVDEMRWDAMSWMKHPVAQTPTLDRIAREGVGFTSSYTASPVCSPARACAFTGRYAHVHGVLNNGVPAHPGEIFLPSILKHYGYHTAISGKLHYTPVEFDYGFDQFWSFSAEGPTPELGYSAYLRKKYSSPAKWPKVEGSCPWPDDALGQDVGLFKYPREDFETEWITDRSIDHLRSRQGKPQPWFLFTSYLKPHSPSVEPEPYFSMYDPAKMPIPKLPPNAAELRRKQTGQSRRHYVDNEEMMRRISAIYFGAINHVDDQIGRLLQELSKLGMADDTLILFTADHGNMLGDHGRWFKGLQYEGSVHVPLLWKGPKGAAENTGRTIEKPVDTTDLVPSILETAGIPIPEGVQGRSFVKLARGRDAGWKPRVFSQLRSGMVLDGTWKLIDNSPNLDGLGPFELFDLRSDPKEQRDLSGDPKHRERIAAYQKELAAWRASHPAPVHIEGMPTPNYALSENLGRAPRKGGAAKKRNPGKRGGLAETRV